MELYLRWIAVENIFEKGCHLNKKYFDKISEILKIYETGSNQDLRKKRYTHV